MYFNPFPKTEYSLGSKTETVVDIFRKVAISQNNTDSIFTEELVGDSDNVESLAEKYYGLSSYWWLIAWYNEKPTESHFAVGDIVLIPTPFQRMISLYNRT